MNKRIKIFLIAVVVIAVVAVVFNLEMIRDVTARQFNTISVINAKERMQDALEKQYPDDSFKFVSGSYKNADGEDDDTCYTGDYVVNGQSDNVISVVCSDKKSADAGEDNIAVEIQTKPYERKITLVNRLAREYTELVKKEMWDELNPYIMNQTDILVKSFYQDPDYDAPLPEWLEYGVKFDRTRELDYEFRFTVQVYQEGEEKKIMRETMDSLTNKGLMFEQYEFMFASGRSLIHYVFDSSGDLKEQWTEEI